MLCPNTLGLYYNDSHARQIRVQLDFRFTYLLPSLEQTERNINYLMQNFTCTVSRKRLGIVNSFQIAVPVCADRNIDINARTCERQIILPCSFHEWTSSFLVQRKIQYVVSQFGISSRRSKAQTCTRSDPKPAVCLQL